MWITARHNVDLSKWKQTWRPDSWGNRISDFLGKILQRFHSFPENQRRVRGFAGVHVFAIHPLGYEVAVLVPHHDFCAVPGKTVSFRKGDCAADGLVLAQINLGITSSAPNNLPPGLFADDHVS